MAILQLSALPAQSQIAGYDRKLRRRAILQDIYVNMTGVYNGVTKTIPNAAYLDVQDVATNNANTATITMKLPLVGLPVVGNALYPGTEEAPSTKAATIYRNNFGKTVRVETYGVRKLDQEPYGLYRTHIDDLGTWSQQYEGFEIRQSLCECYAYNLQFGDTAANCGALINPHVMVQNRSYLQQPAYNGTLTTYTNNIVSQILASGGGSLAPTNAQAASFRLFNNIALFAYRRRLWPLSIGGKHAFMLVVSPLFASIYADPTWANSGGAQWIQFTNLNKEVQNWYGIHGVFHSSIGIDIYIVVDQKHPTVLPSGTAAPYSLTFGYVWPGDNDLRNLDNANTRDVNILIGRGASQKWNPEKLHFIKQDENYFKIMGHGVAGVRGIQMVRFDQQNPNSTSLEYYGSALVLTARPTYV